MAAPGAGITIRRAERSDDPAALALAREALGWAGDERDARFFEWKHRENPFGESPMWVALDGGRVVGFRAFLRWELAAPGGRRYRAVRAVDTATHPEYRGGGVFSRLTLGALPELAAEGVDFVFNTPNDQSLPGYLKMGWQRVGRVPLAARFGGPGALGRMLRARVPAEKWPVETDAGIPAAEAFSDGGLVRRLIEGTPAAGGVATPRTAGLLAWRYGFEPLGYRVLADEGGDEGGDGLAVFRLRRRGAALESVLCDVLGGRAGVARTLARRVLRESGADYLVAARSAVPSGGGLPLPGQGPVLAYRALTGAGAAPERWSLTLGDVELL